MSAQPYGYLPNIDNRRQSANYSNLAYYPPYYGYSGYPYNYYSPYMMPPYNFYPQQQQMDINAQQIRRANSLTNRHPSNFYSNNLNTQRSIDDDLRMSNDRPLSRASRAGSGRMQVLRQKQAQNRFEQQQHQQQQQQYNPYQQQQYPPPNPYQQQQQVQNPYQQQPQQQQVNPYYNDNPYNQQPQQAKQQQQQQPNPYYLPESKDSKKKRLFQIEKKK